MPFASGTRLGAYEVTGSLGAGGMGEVYRATDLKLGREVAIKTLPTSLAQERDRLARFEREAKLLAALNHAHIASVYSLDEHEGALYLAMELVEGETLARKLEAGPIPVDDALHLALQIAEALEAAHEKGVVHRDLKPANIMVTRDGVVKVLDFGLAKAFSGNPNEASPAHSPALSLAMTQAGLILGTAGYMSPEQASGQATDQRADIWAFGVVLYEMLTGMPLFSGESVPHILAGVLRADPDWDRLPNDLQPRLKRVLERCLEKRVRNRYHSIADVRIEIEDVLRNPEAAAAAAQSAAPTKRRALPIAAAFVIGAAAAGIAAWTATRSTSLDIARFDLTPDDGPTVALNSPSVAISPDGQSIAYLAGGDGRGAGELRLRRLSQLEASALTPADGPRLSGPFFSADGTQIGYYTTGADGAPVQLKRISTQGGPSSTIASIPDFLRGASWGADGTIVFATGGASSGLWRVRAAGGEPERLTTPGPDGGAVGHMWPEILPGGEAVLFTIVGASDEASRIAVLSLATGEQRVLVQGGSSPHYSPTGHVLYGRSGTLFAVPFDLSELAVRGDAVPVQERVLTKGVDGAMEVSLDARGNLLYLQGTPAVADMRRLVWVDTTGRETQAPTPARPYTQLVLSPDETRAAVAIEGDPAVWIVDLSRGTLQRLPAELGEQEPSVLFFSADGRRVAAGVRRGGGRFEVVWVPTDGVGQPETLVTFDESVQAVQSGELSRNGEHFLLTVGRGTPDLGVGIVAETESFRDFLVTPNAEVYPAFSPDGGWIAYASNETGLFEVYLRRFPQGGDVVPVTIGGAGVQFFSRDGGSLSYLSFEGGLVASSIVRAPVGGLDRPDELPALESPSALFPWRYYFVADARSHFDMTADGDRFLVISGGAGGGPGEQLVLVQNWAEELRRLVPADP